MLSFAAHNLIETTLLIAALRRACYIVVRSDLYPTSSYLLALYQLVMKRLFLFASVLFFATNIFAQSRDIGARRLLLDDGAGHVLRISPPVGMTLGTYDWVLPLPPSGVDAGFVEKGTLLTPYLLWDDALGYWKASNTPFALPFSQSFSSASDLFSLTNTGTGGTANFTVNNGANSSTVLDVSHNGIGSGIVVQLTNLSNGARGIDVMQAGVGPGVFATSAGGTAVWGITSAMSGAGVLGDNTYGEAVVGRNRGGNGVGAVVGRNDSSGYGVRGFNTKDGIGVLGQAGISGGTGVGGRFENVNAANTNEALAVATNGIGQGISVQITNVANGARGIDVTHSGVGSGVFSTSGGMGVWGITSSISAAGILGDNTYGEAVVGRNRGGNGVGAVVGRNDSSGYGVRGFNTKDGIGVLGQAGISGGTGAAGRFENVNAANTTTALQVSTNSAGNAASFIGNVVITGDLSVSGAVAKGSGSFKIDHPLDPQNRYLYHSFVESDEMKNIYDGVVAMDARGEAVVHMPDWFEAVNMDFRYQLTSIGSPSPGLYIAEEVSKNTFKIAGGVPGQKVSWMLTGVRHDPYAKTYPIKVDVAKSDAERGTYLHPEAYGQPSRRAAMLNAAQSNINSASSTAAQPVERTPGRASQAAAPATSSSSPASAIDRTPNAGK